MFIFCTIFLLITTFIGGTHTWDSGSSTGFKENTANLDDLVSDLELTLMHRVKCEENRNAPFDSYNLPKFDPKKTDKMSCNIVVVKKTLDRLIDQDGNYQKLQSEFDTVVKIFEYLSKITDSKLGALAKQLLGKYYKELEMLTSRIESVQESLKTLNTIKEDRVSSYSILENNYKQVSSHKTQLDNLIKLVSFSQKVCSGTIKQNVANYNRIISSTDLRANINNKWNNLNVLVSNLHSQCDEFVKVPKLDINVSEVLNEYKRMLLEITTKHPYVTAAMPYFKALISKLNLSESINTKDILKNSNKFIKATSGTNDYVYNNNNNNNNVDPISKSNASSDSDQTESLTKIINNINNYMIFKGDSIGNLYNSLEKTTQNPMLREKNNDSSNTKAKTPDIDQNDLFPADFLKFKNLKNNEEKFQVDSKIGDSDKIIAKTADSKSFLFNSMLKLTKPLAPKPPKPKPPKPKPTPPKPKPTPPKPQPKKDDKTPSKKDSKGKNDKINVKNNSYSIDMKYTSAVNNPSVLYPLIIVGSIFVISIIIGVIFWIVRSKKLSNRYY